MQFYIRTFYCFLLVFCGIFAPAAHLHAFPLSGPLNIDWVADGDTVYSREEIGYRLQGIDAPETGHEHGQEQYFAAEASNFLRGLIEEKRVYLDRDHLSRDRYGRYVCRLYFADGTCLNRVMVLKGFAFYYPHGKEITEFKRSLLNAQKMAIASQKGFWPRILSLDDARENWIGNRESKRFHSPKCRFGKKIGRKNRRVFRSLKGAFEAGFAPCRNCSPWPTAD